MSIVQVVPIATAVLDMALLNHDEESVLRLGDGPQSLRLVLTNRTAHDIELGEQHGTSLRLTFRPGALDHVDELGARGQGWTATLAAGRQELQTLVLTRSEPLTVAPRVPHELMVTGLVPSPAGGSRSTRVEVEYSDVHLVGEGPVAGRRILHLGLLHERVPTGATRGSFATSGPFEASIVGSGDIVTGGGPNRIHLRLRAVDPVVVVGGADDVMGRFTIHTPQGEGDTIAVAEVLATQGPWSFASLDSEVLAEYDSNEQTSLDGDVLDVTLQIATGNEPGLYPLYVRYENLGDDDGEIVLLLRVSAIGIALTGDPNEWLMASRSLRVDGSLRAQDLFVDGAARAQELAVDGAARAQELAVDGSVRAEVLVVDGNARARSVETTGATTTGTLRVDGAAVVEGLHAGSTRTRDLQVDGVARASRMDVGPATTGDLRVNGSITVTGRIDLPGGWSLSADGSYMAIRHDGRTVTGFFASDGGTANRTGRMNRLT